MSVRFVRADVALMEVATDAFTEPVAIVGLSLGQGGMRRGAAFRARVGDAISIFTDGVLAIRVPGALIRHASILAASPILAVLIAEAFEWNAKSLFTAPFRAITILFAADRLASS